MSDERHEPDTQPIHPPSDAAPSDRTQGSDLPEGDRFGRAVATAARLGRRLDERVRREPYVALGVACMIGTAVGIAVSSRIVRGALAATTTWAAIEATRAVVRMGAARMASSS